MKKIIISLIMSSICLNFSFGQCSDMQMYDIYTPMGNYVKTYLMCEASTTERVYYDNYYSSAYPNAQKIIIYDNLSSTRKFNCHGYAWLRVEQGIDRWIGYSAGNRDPDVYMTYGSYTQVPSETFPGKVFWDRPNGDHTAITTDQPGWFISKWNQFPLFRHRWDDSPYGTNFKYYVRNCSVLGNETINFTNRIITSYTSIKSCGNINVQNVKVQNGAKLILDAVGEVNIISDFEVELGLEFEIKYP